MHMICVTFSSDSDNWKLNMELKKQHVGMKTRSGASICHLGTNLLRVLTTLSRVFTLQSNSGIKFKSGS